MNDIQKKTSQGIVNLFETGRLAGNYGSVVVAASDPGHLTFGRSQTTLASGNLYILIRDYCGAAGATFANDLRPYLDRLQAIDLTLDSDLNLRSILARSGSDPGNAAGAGQVLRRNLLGDGQPGGAEGAPGHAGDVVPGNHRDLRQRG